MPSEKVSVLTREAVASTARNFQWKRKLPKWTAVVDGRELPARPLILEAAGATPNDPTNSHQAIAVLQELGFAVRYQGKPIQSKVEDRSARPVTDDFIHSLRGCSKGEGSLVEAREREHQIEKSRLTHG
ncbi:MAG: hypothetical protein WBV55_04490 [Candidatus Sulfotelmatobacter sp.]